MAPVTPGGSAQWVRATSHCKVQDEAGPNRNIKENKKNKRNTYKQQKWNDMEWKFTFFPSALKVGQVDCSQRASLQYFMDSGHSSVRTGDIFPIDAAHYIDSWDWSHLYYRQFALTGIGHTAHIHIDLIDASQWRVTESMGCACHNVDTFDTSHW